jgi:CheY-like chemotaxis protein
VSGSPSPGLFSSRDDGEDGGPLTILVVEPDPVVAERVRAGLNGVPGWGATVVRDAAAALAVGRHLRVDALVLALHPPGLAGLALLARWRADPNRSGPPVVLTTVHPAAPEARAAVAAGAVAALVPKPFDVDALVATLRRVVGGGARPA